MTMATHEIVELGRELITPALAEEWLRTNSRNRRISERHVNFLAKVITNGEWVYNGDSIKFTADGVLADGQHRLRAIIKSGIPVESLVVMGVSDHAMETLDTVKRRTMHDLLQIRGDAHASVLAVAVSYLQKWRETGKLAQLGRTDRPSHSELLLLLEQHPRLREHAARARVLRKAVGVSDGYWAVVGYILNEINEEDADYFLDRLADGVLLPESSPIFLLRARLLHERAKRTGRLSTYELGAITLKAWNLYRDGTEPGHLAWRAGGASPEPYPIPH